MSRIYDPYFNGPPFCDAIDAPKLPSHATNIFILLAADLFGILKEKMGLSNL